MNLDNIGASVRNSLQDSIDAFAYESVYDSVGNSIWDSVSKSLYYLFGIQ